MKTKQAVKKEEVNHALEQAKAQLRSIVEMVDSLNADYDRLEELYQTAAHERKIEHPDLKPSAEDLIILDEIDLLKEAAGECNSQEEAQERIQNDPLSVEVRSGWNTVGSVTTPEEFKILLCWGGPAVQIIGELDEHAQPENPRIQYQDWFTGWTDLIIESDEDQAALQTYCEQFYFEC